MDNTRSKKIGKYRVYLFESYEGFGRSKTFENGQVAVFISGMEKGLQRREDYSNKKVAIRKYKMLSSVKKVELWISRRGF